MTIFNSFNWKYVELTEDALALIEAMRLRHEAEIHSLSEQLKLEPEFIKVRHTLLLIYLLLYLYLHLELFIKVIKKLFIIWILSLLLGVILKW